jgi:predicted membrane protein
MKMCFLFSGLFWGCVLILLGLSVIIRVVFHVHIPVFRIVVALVFIYLGVKILAGGFGCRMREHGAFFGHSKVNYSGQIQEQNVIFGSSQIDATGPLAPGENKTLRINTVMGSSVIRISRNVPTAIKISTAFSSVRTPDGSQAAFGESVYRNKAAEGAEAVRNIVLHVVFGAVDVMEE